MDRPDAEFDDALKAFADSALGGALSPPVQALLERAAALPHAPEQAQSLLEEARALAPGHPAPLIALYRFHFYGHRLAQARAAGEDALAIARTALGPDFGDDPPADDDTRHHAAVRFYLFALKGLAYLNLRLGAHDDARMLLGELRRLDPKDHVGAGLLAHVLARHELGDDGPDGDSLPAHPARGWEAPPSAARKGAAP